MKSHSDDDKLKWLKGLGIDGITNERIHSRDVDKYQLKDDEELSADGQAIICSKCGGVRYLKKYSEFFGTTRWETYTCDCKAKEEFERNAENERSRWPEIIRNTYNAPVFLGSCIGETLKDIKWSDPKFSGPDQNESFIRAKNILSRFCNTYDDRAEEKMGFYLYSPTRGNGKTTLCGMVRNELLGKGISCAVVTLDYLSSLSIERKQDFQKLVHIKCLIIDDIGVTKMTDWKNQLLYEILSWRSCDKDTNGESKYVTCFTSNFSISELSNSEMNTANISRIQGCAKAIIKIDSPSMRGVR